MLPESGESATPKARPLDFPAIVKEKISANAIEFLHNLPPTSHFRSALVGHLLRGLPVEIVMQITGLLKTSVYNALSQYGGDDMGGLDVRYPTNVTRQVVPEEELASIREVVRQNMLSAGSGLRHLLTNEELYRRYVASFAESMTKLVEQHQQHVRDVSSLGPAEPSMETLVRKFNDHAQQLAFVAWARTAAVGSGQSEALGGGHSPGPIDEVLSFLSAQATSPPAPRSRSVFDHALHDVHAVRTHKDWGNFDCSHCAKGERDEAKLAKLAKVPLPLSSADAAALDELETAVREFHEHLSVVHSQCAAVESALSDPDPTHVCVTWDFAQIDTQPNVGDKHKAPFHVLIMCIKRGGSDEHVFVDFFVADRSAEQPDIFFVREALLFLVDQTPFLVNASLVTFISDTCAGEFRSRYVFAQMASLQQRCSFAIQLLFKAARHGKGMADAHKGHLSRIVQRHLKQLTLMRQQQPSASSAILTAFPDAESLALFLSNSFHTVEYHAFLLPSVDRNPALKADVRGVAGTMQLHEITFDSADVIRTKHKSSDVHADIVHLHFNKPYQIDGAVVCDHLADFIRWHVGTPWPSSSVALSASSLASGGVHGKLATAIAAAGDGEKKKSSHAGTKRKVASSVSVGDKRPKPPIKEGKERELPCSVLKFDDVRDLKHVFVAHRLPQEPEVDLWKADVVGVHANTQTLDIRLREWPVVLRNVQPHCVFKPSSALPAV